MSTSGVTTFNPNRDQILRGALRLVNAYASSDDPRPEQMNDALESLNMLLKAWQVEGFLWLKTFAYLFLNKGTVSYSLGTLADGGSHCVTEYIKTSTAADAVAGAGAVTLTTGHGLTTTATGYVGIANDNGTIEWFQGYTVAGDTLTLTVPQVLSANAASGNVVYAHTAASQIKRPTRIFTCSRKNNSDYDIPITPLSREDYAMLPNKTVQAPVNQFFYDPQTVIGKIYVWPTSDTTTDILFMTVDRPIQDMVSDTDTADIPQEWIECLKYGLAVRIAPEYGVTIAERQMLDQEYVSLRANIAGYDRQTAPTMLQWSDY